MKTWKTRENPTELQKVLILSNSTLKREDIEDLEESAINELFYDLYEIDDEQFDTLIENLLPLCMLAQSPLSNIWYQGFEKDGVWLLKKEFTNDLSSIK